MHVFHIRTRIRTRAGDSKKELQREVTTGMVVVVAAATMMTEKGEEAPPPQRRGRRRRRQSIIAAATPPFHVPRPPTRPRPSGAVVAAATATAAERESRSSRMRQDGLRRRARQLERMKRVVDRHALKVATGEKMKKQQHVYDLTASSSIPSAASASQRWRGVMRRVRGCSRSFIIFLGIVAQVYP